MSGPEGPGPLVGRELPPHELAALHRDPVAAKHLETASAHTKAGPDAPKGVALMRAWAWLAEHDLHCMLSDAPAAAAGAAAKPEAHPLSQGLPRQPGNFRAFAGASGGPPPRPKLVTEDYDTIKETEVEWLWPGRIPVGMPSLLLGKMGDGKSTFVSWLAATVSAGHNWPDSPDDNEPGTVLILQAEESKGSAIKPRLNAFGYGRGKVHAVTGVDRGDGHSSWFSLAKDCEALGDECERRGDVRLIIVDPLGSYIRGISGYNESETREYLQPLFTLAEKHELAVLLVAHPNKDAEKEVLDRISGSGAFGQMVRMAWYLSVDPSDKSRRLLSLMKGNAHGATRTAIAVHYEERKRRMTWLPDAVDLQARDVDYLLQKQAREAKVQGKQNGPNPAEANKAQEFVLDFLKAGPTLQSAAEDQGLNHGIKGSTFRRAMKRLIDVDGRVRRFRDKEDGRWWLRLATAEESAENSREGGADGETPDAPATPPE